MARRPRRGQASLAALAKGIYAVPDPMRTYEEFRRFSHADLTGMDREALQIERARLRLCFLLQPEDEPLDAWLVERAQAVEEALRRAR